MPQLDLAQVQVRAQERVAQQEAAPKPKMKFKPILQPTKKVKTE
jgi:hypothetical protein